LSLLHYKLRLARQEDPRASAGPMLFCQPGSFLSTQHISLPLAQSITDLSKEGELPDTYH